MGHRLQSAPATADDPNKETGDLLRLVGLSSALAGPFAINLPRGSITVIMGASGSGKSLFLRMVADLDPNEGEVMLGRKARSAMSGPEWRKCAPYVGAEAAWWCETANDHFAPEHRDAARSLALRLGIDASQLNVPIGQLSTGERHRLSLIRAFVLQPAVLLLDEPTGPLDPESVRKVEALIAGYATAGGIALVVSHDPAQASRLGANGFDMVDRRLVPRL